MSQTPRKPQSLAERFWSLARAQELSGGELENPDPVSVVNQVLAILDELERGETGGDLSVATMSFLQLLRAHEVGGDLSYASPEQIRGESMDERSLVFSIGVLIFERLTGRHPFGATGNPRRVARISQGEFGSGVNYFPSVPPGLRSVLMKAMGPFPEERWASLEELRRALEHFADRSQPAVRLPGTQEDEETQIFRPGISSKALAQAAASGHVGTVREHTPHAFATERDEPQRPASGGARRAAPLLWMALGAVAASAVFLFSGHGSGKAAPDGAKVAAAGGDEAPAAEPPTVQPLAAEPVAGAKPAAPEPKAKAKAKPEPAAKPEPVATAKPEPAKPAPVAAARPAPASDTPPPAEFSPQRGGDRAAQVITGCIDKSRLAEGDLDIGVSIRYRADGSIHKLYYANDAPLGPEERTCLHEHLSGYQAGKLDKARVVEYRLHVSASGAEAVVTSP